jgi:hypothetical protein
MNLIKNNLKIKVARRTLIGLYKKHIVDWKINNPTDIHIIKQHMPLDFIENFLELYQMDYGWDGSNELPIDKTVLFWSLRLVVDLFRKKLLQGFATSWPEMCPGFRGDIGIEYSSEYCDLIIDIKSSDKDDVYGYCVSSEPNSLLSVICLGVLRDDNKKIKRFIDIDPNNLNNYTLPFVV